MDIIIHFKVTYNYIGYLKHTLFKVIKNDKNTKTY
jgi:hypothetical protein